MAENIKCPIWGTTATRLSERDYGDKVAYESPRAGGQYTLTGTASAIIGNLSDAERLSITQWIVEQNYIGADAYITSTTLKDIRDRKLPAADKRAEWLLRFLVRSSEHLGQTLGFESNAGDRIYGDSAGTFSPLLAWSSSKNLDEVIFLLHFLKERGFVSLDTGKSSMGTKRLEGIVQPEGYAYLSERQSSLSDSNQVFIAMWFDKSMDDVYEKGFERAIRETGYEPLRIDRKEHNNKIDDEIMAEIRRSRFIVSDFTARLLSDEDKTIYEARGGVYFEAGFALGLEIPVIWSCREDMISHVHFDTRQFNHIAWSNADDLCTKLKKRISGTIGDGPFIQKKGED